MISRILMCGATALVLATLAVAEDPAAPPAPAPTSTSTPAPAPEANLRHRPVPVLFRERTAFHLHVPVDNDKAAARAAEASEALSRAMNAPEPFEAAAKDVDVIQERDILAVKVRGYRILDLTKADAQAAGHPSLEEYQNHLKPQLSEFVAEERSRLRIQGLASQFFISIFIALLGFVAFRQVNRLFNRADHVLDERRESFQAISLLSEQLISAQTMGALLAFSLALGRIVTYIIVILTTFLAILGQFQSTRTLMARFFSDIAVQVFHAFQSLIKFIPGLILALILAIGLQVVFRILDLFLKGVASGRIHWHVVTETRIPVVRFWGYLVIVVIFGPLIVAAVFGRFHTPIESVLLIVAAILLLSALPVLAAYAAGSFVLWQNQLKVGQFIQIGDRAGTIARLTLTEVTLTGTDGAPTHVPTLYFLFHPVREIGASDRFELIVTLELTETPRTLAKKVQNLFPADWHVQARIASVSSRRLQVRLSTSGNDERRAEILSALGDASLAQRISLTEDFIEESRT